MRILVCISAVLAALSLVAAASAKTIVGTSRSDVLRGTRSADTIYGKAGNDRLYGLAGNDRLIGGPGADLLSCGPGRDIAVADNKDRVGADCEVVQGRTPPPAPPLPPPANLPPTALFTATPTSVRVGAAVAFDASASTDSDGSIAAYSWDFGDRSTSTGRVIDHAYAQAGTYNVKLTVTDDRGATGTAAATITVTALPPPPPPPPPAPPLVTPGHYSVTTHQGSLGSLDVGADGRSITGFNVPATSPCSPSGAVNSAIVIGQGGTFSIAPDRSFAASGEGPTGITGATGTYSITLAGSFDGAGNVSGTARVKDSFTLNGTHYECDSDVIKFSGHL